MAHAIKREKNSLAETSFDMWNPIVWLGKGQNRLGQD